MPYIGVHPVEQASMVLTQGTLGESTNTINVPSGYTPSNIAVYVNGLRLKTTDYTASDGFTITLNEAVASGSEYVIEEFRSFEVADFGVGQVTTSTGTQSITEALGDRLNRDELNLDRDTDLVLSVPSQYLTIRDAIESIKTKNLPVGSRVRVEIAEGAYSGGSWNAITTINNSMSSVIDIVGLGTGADIATDLNDSEGIAVPTTTSPYKPFLYIDNVPFGRITNVTISGTGTAGNAVGGILVKGGNASVTTDARIEFKTVDDDVFGIAAFDGAFVNARGADVSGCGNRDEFDVGGVYESGNSGADAAGSGIYTWGGVNVVADYITANRCGRGLNFSRGTVATCANATANDCVHHGLLATRSSHVFSDGSSYQDTLDDCLVAKWSSSIQADGANISGSRDKTGAIAGESSSISLRNATCFNAGTTAIAAIRLSNIDAEGIVITGAGHDGARAEDGSRISIKGASITGSGRYNVASFYGSYIEASSSTLDDANDHCIYAQAGEINAIDSTATGSVNGSGVYATSGGKINARNVDASGSGVTSEVQMYNGSIINFTGGTGNVQATIVVNGVSDKGLFFQ